MKLPTACLAAIATVSFSASVHAERADQSGNAAKRTAAAVVSDKARVEDLGLPAYPGSRPHEKQANDSSAANVGLSSPWFGFKVVAMSFETTDAPEKVAAFYRQALAKYGAVLECKPTAGAADAQPRQADKDGLVCDVDERSTHSVVYKVGIETRQRIAAIKPRGRGTQFDLVYLDIRGD